jgi:UDP-N-acetylglucosamine--N-acetylmuramyl-(pentapeptide) pyrophosphoryl-undecaprenol N-acetylglucosamine transferase
VIWKKKKNQSLSQLQRKYKVIISGGGTGGHIFPAVAIANALKKMDSSIDILFVGAKGKMEMEKIPAAGYKIEGLWISGLQRNSFKSNLSFPFKLVSSLRQAGKIIKRFQPDVAVGVGGYASGPLLYMATRKNIPALIQEQNSFPGITNKLLAKKVNKICVAYDGMERFFPKDKIIKTGNPVREDVVKIEGKKYEAINYFGLEDNLKTILVVGGSQGARSINLSIKGGLEKIKESGCQLIWQTGKLFYGEAASAAESLNSNKIKVYDFINRMDLAYSIADLVVTRAGASTVSELCIVAKPSILIPLPTAAEDHQTKNCMALVNRNAGILVKDNDAMATLVSKALETIQDTEKLSALSKNIRQLALPDSAKTIAKEVLQLAKYKN